MSVPITYENPRGSGTPFFIAGAFLLNLAWEMSQSFLFVSHYSGVVDFVLIHIIAALTDVVITFLILSPGLLFFGQIFQGRPNGRRIALTVISGFLMAVLIERYALLTGMWSYGPYMPTLPFLGVGLTPVLQMVCIPAVLLYEFGVERVKPVSFKHHGMNRNIDDIK